MANRIDTFRPDVEHARDQRVLHISKVQLEWTKHILHIRVKGHVATANYGVNAQDYWPSS